MMLWLQIATLLGVLTLVAFELPHRVRARRHALKRAFVDEGIAFAARWRRGPHGAGLSDHDEHRIAMDWAKDQLDAHKIKVTANELSKLVSLRRTP